MGGPIIINSKLEELSLPGDEVTIEVYHNENFEQTLYIFNKYKEMLAECPILRKGNGIEIEVRVNKTYIEKAINPDRYIIVMEGVVI